MQLQMIDAQTVHRLLNWADLVEAFRAAHLIEPPKTARIRIEQPDTHGLSRYLTVVPAWHDPLAMGVKITTSYPNNPAKTGHPSVNAIFVSFDPVSGVPKAVIDGEALIFRKTAGESALAISLLSDPSAENLLVIGAGGLAPYLIDAALAVRPTVRSVRIWNRTAEKAEALAEKLRSDGIDAVAISALSQGLSWADIVISATMATQPVVEGEYLKDGSHVNLVGSFTPSMREIDDLALTSSTIFVDSYACLETSGDFTSPIARQVISQRDVAADLFELCRDASRHGSTGKRRTVFKNSGAMHLDLVAVQCLMRSLQNSSQSNPDEVEQFSA